MPRPEVTPTTELAYSALSPLTTEDERLDWPLLRYLEPMLSQLDLIERVARDTKEYVGWGRLMDLDETDNGALVWLAQLVGVVVLRGIDTESQRIRVREAAGWNRGKVSAIKGAMRQFLTGNRTTQVFERYQGNAYHLRVRTIASETPDPAKVEAAVRALKPAALILIYDVSAGQSYDELAVAVSTYDDMSATYDTYDDARLALPPEV